MYSKFQKEEALKTYREVGSVDRTIYLLGYPTRRCLYGWIREQDKENEANGIPVPTHKRGRKPRQSADKGILEAVFVSHVDRETIDQLQVKLHQMQLSLDLLQEIIRLKQQKPSFNLDPISQREKSEVIDVLRAKYPLHELLDALEIDRSAYYYHHGSLERKKGTPSESSDET
ncbi:MAG: hypothetical protein J6P72_01580 [Firmicutes bacterium]|nr:hypothetical protein [Bacillota bacterium]